MLLLLDVQWRAVYILCLCGYKRHVTSNTVGLCAGCVDGGFVLVSLLCYVVYQTMLVLRLFWRSFTAVISAEMSEVGC